MTISIFYTAENNCRLMRSVHRVLLYRTVIFIIRLVGAIDALSATTVTFQVFFEVRHSSTIYPYITISRYLCEPLSAAIYVFAKFQKKKIPLNKALVLHGI